MALSCPTILWVNNPYDTIRQPLSLWPFVCTPTISNHLFLFKDFFVCSMSKQIDPSFPFAISLGINLQIEYSFVSNPIS